MPTYVWISADASDCIGRNGYYFKGGHHTLGPDFEISSEQLASGDKRHEWPRDLFVIVVMSLYCTSTFFTTSKFTNWNTFSGKFKILLPYRYYGRYEAFITLR
ncbi:hypothetical protein AcW1_006397 [Taiwanofungus camphoratus]|nr:hypothetical protein AcW2_005159 [Antrodia cinnamomea]KAI0954529.1 hypothetical protein AcW1_006397 [Antrodia cinnamomea]